MPNKSLGVSVSEAAAGDFKAICEHHGHPMNRVLNMLVYRVIDHPERLPQAMQEYEDREKTFANSNEATG
jgi:antitoxin component of RelBE/YafQ-DinJ toxin-antitoxin module